MLPILSRKMIVTLILMSVSALVLVAASVPAAALASTRASVDRIHMLSTLPTLPYIRQLCPGDVVQGEVSWRGLTSQADAFPIPNFTNADLYYLYGNAGDIVWIDVHRLTSAMDPFAAMYEGYESGLTVMAFSEGNWGLGSVHGVGGTGDDIWGMNYQFATAGFATLAIWDHDGFGPGPAVPYDVHVSNTIPPCGSQEIQISIDIKPGDMANSININGNGVIPVAILGSASFNVGQIDVNTLEFAGMDVRVRGNGTPQCGVEDVNADGFGDLVCQFVDDPTSWSPDNGTANVTGNLRPEFGGTEFWGTDSITLIQG